MFKRSVFKSAVLLIAVLFVASCFSGCDDIDDIYGTASDYIKVSHPETADDDNGYVVPSSDSDTSSVKPGQTESKPSDTDTPGKTADDTKEGANGEPGNGGNTDDPTSADEQNGESGSNVIKHNDDYGPIVTFS